MHETVQKLLAQGKGILAADESTKTIDKRFAALEIESTPETHKKYREMLFTTPGIENYISGVILFEESVEQGLQKILEDKGIVPGIKVDGGLEPFNETEEQVTKGLGGLAERLTKYTGMGLKFSKWRGVFKINDKYPSDAFYEENLTRMARYAKISQDAGLVPIVEPEILLEGNHTTTRCSETIDETLTILFKKLDEINVDITKLLVKTSMSLPGPESGVKALPLEVANSTLRALNKSVPREVPGIVFLSGGQTPDEATDNLNEIIKLKENAPWQISFSFSRALQEEAMKEWGGKDENIALAQKVFIMRLEKVSNARNGKL
jgi:fructose-bisphosphate aldolase class I